MLFLKCPRCHKAILLEANPNNLGKFNKVKERCPKCDWKYIIEPSFYYDTVYVSYRVGIALAAAVFVLIKLFGLDFGPWGIFLSNVAGLVLLMTYKATVSKSIWVTIFSNMTKV